MNKSKDVFVEILTNIEKNKSLSLKKIADCLNTNENEIKPIISIYIKCNFIKTSNQNHGYQITKIGKEYLNIKS